MSSEMGIGGGEFMGTSGGPEVHRGDGIKPRSKVDSDISSRHPEAKEIIVLSKRKSFVSPSSSTSTSSSFFTSSTSSSSSSGTSPAAKSMPSELRRKFIAGNRGLSAAADLQFVERIEKGELGAGGFGQVFAGKATLSRGSSVPVALKTSLPEPVFGGGEQSIAAIEEPDDEIMAEFEKTESLRKAAVSKLDRPGNLLIDQQGMDALILGQGVARDEDGDSVLIQERVIGSTLSESIPGEGFEFYRSGYPKNLQGACLMGAELMLALHSVHSAGRVHGDMKPANIMLTEDMHVRIIDFGTMGKIGEDSSVLSFGNGAPETMQDGYKLHPAEDIFAAGVCLLSLLFGRKAKPITSMFSRAIDRRPTRYERKVANKSFKRRKTYFLREITKLNDEIKGEGSDAVSEARQARGYPDKALNVIAGLLAKMCSLGPEERSEALECHEVLMHLGLSTWERGRFLIGGRPITSPLLKTLFSGK